MSDNSTDSTETAAGGPTKSCKICAWNIPSAARKCTNCDSFQSWRDRLNLSPTVLSLLIALISTVVAALPVIQAYSTKDDSDIYVQFLNAGPGVNLVAVNRGTKPGFVAEGTLQHRGQEVAHMVADNGDTATLVPPGQVVRIRYQATASGRGRVATGLELRTDEWCQGLMTIINFRSDRASAAFPMPCIAHVSN